jgi:argininosuccinate lyase
MPIYTHYQAAQPVVLGHYLMGIVVSLDRDLSNLLYILNDLNESPLGAGAIAGTSIKINQHRTAELLGFATSSINSIDAIASRDYVLRILSCIAITGSTLSRYASDLLLWSTSEFKMIEFPDELVGSSSMMPQKRNAFILEHIQGNTTKALGGFVSAVTAQQSVPFSNSIAVNSASVSNFWNVADEIISSIALMRFMTEGIIPVKERMLQLSKNGFTTATAAADLLTIEAGVPFREAHKIIGSIIKEIVENSPNDNYKMFLEKLSEKFPVLKWENLDPEIVAGNSNFGGGPGKISLKNSLSVLNLEINAQKKEYNKQKIFWNESSKKLEQAVSELIRNEI